MKKWAKFLIAGVIALASNTARAATVVGPISTVFYKDEGVTVSTNPNTIDFVGSGVTVTKTGVSSMTVTIGGGGGLPLTPGDTSYVQVNPASAQSGSFNIGSGTFTQSAGEMVRLKTTGFGLNNTGLIGYSPSSTDAPSGFSGFDHAGVVAPIVMSAGFAWQGPAGGGASDSDEGLRLETTNDRRLILRKGHLALLSTTTARFYDGNSSNYVSFRASDTVASNINWVLPAADGTSNQLMATDGAGNLFFKTDSAGGGGGTTIWGQDDEAVVSNAVSTVTVNGVLKSTVTASSKMAIFLNYDTNQFENQASTFAAKSSSFTMQGPIVSSVSVPAIIGHESTIESVVDLSDLQGQIGDAQIADAAVDGGSGGEIADGSITAHDVDTSSFTLLGPSVTLGTETDGVYLASATAGSSMLITGTNNVESAAPIFNVDPSSVATRADMAALYQPLDATLTDLAAAPLGEDNSISVGAIAAGSLPSDVIASSVAVSAFFSDVTVRSNLGLAIGTNVQAYDADLDDLADGTLSASKVQQNAGTDITADLEEETHATEHADGGSDEITISTANMNATGTASATTFLRGDNTWSSPAGSGDAVLASTQTFSGINTFQSTTTFDGPVADGNGLPGTSGQVFTSNGPDANPTWQNPTGSGSTYDFLLSSWTTQGTFSYTVPSSAAVLNIWLCAGGGSGGGGQGANAGSARSGGSAGGGGACRMVTVSTQSAGATLYVVVGTGTIGGAGGSGVNGNPGSAGGTTIVYSVNNSTIGIVYGGAGGPGGNGDQAGGAGGGWGSAGSLATGGLPTATSNVHGFGGGGAGTAANQAGKVSDFGGAGGGSGDQTGNGANGGQSSYGGGGGGGAAGITAASPGVVGTSGAGGLSGHINSSQSGSGGAAGTGGGTSTPGTKGEDGFFWRGGFGGGGGGSDNDSTGSAGGNGGYCGGGGGGGGSGTNVGGRGGSGGPGCVFILPGV